MDETKELGDQLALARTCLANPAVSPARLADALDSAESMARTIVLAKAGARPGFIGRVFGFDPATLYLIVQLVLLVIELIKQLRQSRTPAS